MTVKEGLAKVEERIGAACARAGRRREEVELIAVSKLHPAAKIREAYEAGQRLFGENYAQELRDKAEELSALPGLRWHAIGPLQANKAKYVARSAHAFHALDRLEIAQELSRRRTGTPLQCYLQLNVGAEATKSGVSPEGAVALAESVRALPGLELVGVMALPPLSDDEGTTRRHFQEIRKVAETLKLGALSMGTTHDYELAIEEGATAVRVGTAIFGERP